MKKLLFWIVLIVGTVALLGSCAKKEESTTAAAASGVCTTCDPLTSTTTAAGSITVGSATLSGTYATSCFTETVAKTLIDLGAAPSDTKSFGHLFIVRGNDNVTEEMNYYSDSTCTTKCYTQTSVLDNVTVGSASGSNYRVAMSEKSINMLVTTTVAETWLEAMYGGLIDVTVGSEYIMATPAVLAAYYGLWNVSATTFKKGFTDDTYPTELDSVDYTKL